MGLRLHHRPISACRPALLCSALNSYQPKISSSKRFLDSPRTPSHDACSMSSTGSTHISRLEEEIEPVSYSQSITGQANNKSHLDRNEIRSGLCSSGASLPRRTAKARFVCDVSRSSRYSCSAMRNRAA